MNRWLLTFALWLGTGLMVLAANTTARLVLPVNAVRPGDTVLAGIVLDMSPDWHTYWRNPGESGMATEVDWRLPDGVTAGAIQWPIPEYYEAAGLVTYVHHHTAVLLVPLQFSETLAPGPLSLEAEVSWLECEVQCVPGGATVKGAVTVSDDSVPSKDADIITRAKLQLPKDGSSLDAKATWDGPAEGEERALLIEWPATGEIDEVQFFPYGGDDFQISPQVERLSADDGRVTLRTLVKNYGEQWPRQLGGLIMLTQGDTSKALTVQLAIEGDDPPAGGTSTAPSTGAGTGRGVVFYLMLALGGGLILNLMPCVLPILSLKVLSLVRQGGSSAGERRKHGMVYTLGVLVSFWAMSGLVIAGRLASWGEQFQDPRFIVVVTILMTLVALNLFGVFEVLLPSSTVTSATVLASKEGASGAFFNGVLAVVLGASCVAPMLAPAVGWAISQPPLIIFIIFTMIGLGLALPFLLLSFFPSLQRLLPKPGAWMEKFKIVMGFPMLATAAWLLSQTVHHFGASGPLWIGLFLVFLAMALWIYGDFVQRGRRRRGLATAIALMVLIGGYAWTMESRLDWRNLPDYTSAANSMGSPARPNGLNWEPWSVEAVKEARANKRWVLVDFTASWCLSCEITVKPALEKEDVIARLISMNAVTLLADFTLQDPHILAGLKEFQRAGVPLVVVYPPSPNSLPQVLPDPKPFQSPSSYARIILEALEAADS